METNAIDAESISNMESPMLEFGNAASWAGISVANSWTPYIVVSQLAEGRSIQKD